VRRLTRVFRRAGLRFSRDGFAFFAQALAFNAIFAVFPILVLTVTVLAFIFGNASGQTRALSLIATLAPGVQGILVENLHQVVRFRGISGVIAFGALLWSGKNLFQGLAFALNRAFDVPEGRPLLSDIVVALVMVPVLSVLFIVATTVPLVIAFIAQNGDLRDAALWTQIAGYGTSVLLIFVVAMVLYVYLPNRRVKLGFGVPGALVFTVAWEIAQIAFAFYSTHVNFTHVYGALAAFALLLIWFYYMATIFLFGAQVSAEWASGTS
jgi:membrane protein